MQIVLTGSLGNISKPLAEELISKGHSVTVISSKADRQKEIVALGAKVAIGPVEDADFLTKIFTGADIVYCMEPSDRSRMFNPAFTLTDLLNHINSIVTNYKQAILRSGVKQVVHLSSIGAHTDTGVGMLQFHHLAENILRSLPDNVSIKFMRPVGFYYNLLAYTQVIKQTSKGVLGALLALRYYGLGGLLSGKRGVIMANYGENIVNLMVSPFDIASAIVEEMEKPFNGRTFRYIASEELTCKETAKILGEAIGKPYLKWAAISDKQMQNAMINMKMSPTIAKGFAEMGASGRSGVLYEDYYHHRPKLGKTKLKEYAKEFAKAYNQN